MNTETQKSMRRVKIVLSHDDSSGNGSLTTEVPYAVFLSLSMQIMDWKENWLFTPQEYETFQNSQIKSTTNDSKQG